MFLVRIMGLLQKLKVCDTTTKGGPLCQVISLDFE